MFLTFRKEGRMARWIKNIEEKINKNPKFHLAEIIRIFIYILIFSFVAHLVYKGSKHVIDYKQPSQKQLIYKNEPGDNCA